MSASEKLNSESKGEPEEDKAKQPVGKIPDGEHPIPLFLRDISEGRHGNEQDEKDETGE